MGDGALRNGASPEIAIILSFMPGFGLLYLRRYIPGAVYAVAGLGCIALCVSSMMHMGSENTPSVGYFFCGMLWGFTASAMSVYDTQRLCISEGMDPDSFFAQAMDPMELATLPFLLIGISLIIVYFLYEDLPGTILLPPMEALILTGYYIYVRRDRSNEPDDPSN